ncbi:MAG: CoA transferase [Comamonadaceae bacterium]|nr:MAG: CoA transferase [Comamonadaceae bacterium]
MAGPLVGIRVLEAGGIGPVPFCGMVLADLGAEVLQVTRPGAARAVHDVPGRGRARIALDLRSDAGREAALALAARADILIEGFRPGVMERLGLGPQPCMARQPRLVYGRMTGWGQEGPLAQAPGHDLNYIGLAGVLHAIGRADQPPVPPLNLVGDYGGGAMLLAVGVLAALQERGVSGRGQVVDAAMSDGSALLGALFHGMRAEGRWSAGRGGNHLDGGAHFYNTYRCADGRHVAVAATEPAFYAELLVVCGIDDPMFGRQWDRAAWPVLKDRLAAVFATRARDEWCRLAEGRPCCLSPVLDWDEAPLHPHNVARDTFIRVDGLSQPAPAPRFSRTPAARPVVGIEATDALLRGWGLPQPLVDTARAAAAAAADLIRR